MRFGIEFTLENVEEFEQWGPLDEDGMPVRDGSCFQDFVNALRYLGYQVEWRVLRACDYGTPTIRKRLFVIARRDGEPIVWPEATHSAGGGGGLKKYRTAAEVIDFEEPMLSIFATAEEAKAWGKAHGRPTPRRPLAENTMKRIAAGTMKYVVKAADPFVISIANYGGGGQQVRGVDGPLSTVTAYPKGGHHALVAPTLIQTGYGERAGQAPRVPGLHKPLGTVVGGGPKHALVAAFLAKHYGGVIGCPVDQPISTVT